VRFGTAALDYLESLPARLPGVDLAVELRDASWLPGHTGETLDFLAARGLGYVSVDAPATPAAVARTLAVTAPFGVLRLHGRNREGFMAQLQGRRPTVAQKYGYLYDTAELTTLVGRTRELEGRARRVYFALNNNVGDAPAINGIQIRELLGQEVADRETVAAEWRARRGRGARGAPGPVID